jgi:hypothetical protein
MAPLHTSQPSLTEWFGHEVSGSGPKTSRGTSPGLVTPSIVGKYSANGRHSLIIATAAYKAGSRFLCNLEFDHYKRPTYLAVSSPNPTRPHPSSSTTVPPTLAHRHHSSLPS